MCCNKRVHFKNDALEDSNPWTCRQKFSKWILFTNAGLEMNKAAAKMFFDTDNGSQLCMLLSVEYLRKLYSSEIDNSKLVWNYKFKLNLS